MSHATTVEVLHVDTPATPRGATLVGLLYTALASLFQRDPAVPSRAEEAAAVRELASRVASTDPSFAADLYAAACRHESLDEVPTRR